MLTLEPPLRSKWSQTHFSWYFLMKFNERIFSKYFLIASAWACNFLSTLPTTHFDDVYLETPREVRMTAIHKHFLKIGLRAQAKCFHSNWWETSFRSIVILPTIWLINQANLAQGSGLRLMVRPSKYILKECHYLEKDKLRSSNVQLGECVEKNRKEPCLKNSAISRSTTFLPLFLWSLE